MTNKQQILALRSQGMTYRQIAQSVGVSFQWVSIICGQADGSHFRPVTEQSCVWPMLRQWMNENKISRNELLRRMRFNTSGNTNAKLARILRGEQELSKPWIDRLIFATGLPYEQLFAQEAGK